MSVTNNDSNLYREFRAWRLTRDASWESFLTDRELRAKAEAFDQLNASTGSIGSAEKPGVEGN